jgi:hypothetical protein
MVFKPGRAYLSNANPQSKVPGKDVSIRVTPDARSKRRRFLSRFVPGIDEIESRTSKSLLAKLFLILSGVSAVSAVISVACLVFAIVRISNLSEEPPYDSRDDQNYAYMAAQQEQKVAYSLLGFAVLSIGSSVGWALVSYGLAQHCSHIARTRECMERLCEMMAGREGTGGSGINTAETPRAL